MLFCLLSIVFSIALQVPANLDQAAVPAQYEHYLELVHGPLTQGKESFLKETSAQITQAKIEYAQLLNLYYKKDITEDSFLAQSKELGLLLENEQGFDAIYTQYRYVYENPGNRYFIATNGWALLLSSNFASSFLLLIFLAVLSIPVFCSEYRCRMEQIALTTARGSDTYGGDKIRLMLLFSLFAVCWQEGVTFLQALSLYGLPDCTAPLQSVAAFASCTKALSLWQAYTLLFLCRLIGAILFSLLTLLAATWIKAFVPTIFTALVLAFLPPLALSEELQYHLPLPTSYLHAVSFLQGPSEFQNELGETVVTFHELSILGVAALLLLGVLLCILCFYEIRKGNRNVCLRKSKFPRSA